MVPIRGALVMRRMRAPVALVGGHPPAPFFAHHSGALGLRTPLLGCGAPCQLRCTALALLHLAARFRTTLRPGWLAAFIVHCCPCHPVRVWVGVPACAATGGTST